MRIDHLSVEEKAILFEQLVYSGFAMSYRPGHIRRWAIEDDGQFIEASEPYEALVKIAATRPKLVQA